MHNILFMVKPEKDEQAIFNTLYTVCSFICQNYEEIKKELCCIGENIRHLETSAAAYLPHKFPAGMVNAQLYKTDAKYLAEITRMLNLIEEKSSEEFFQSVDFFNLHKLLSGEGRLLHRVWYAKKVYENIVHQIERIKCESDIYKKIAILKGMIACY